MRCKKSRVKFVYKSNFVLRFCNQYVVWLQHLWTRINDIYRIRKKKKKTKKRKKTIDVLLCRILVKEKTYLEDIRFRCEVHWWHRRFRWALKTSANRAPALLSLLQDLRMNIVKNTTVTVYELIRSVYGRSRLDLY